jgi:acetate---CoA ligase (ADP-forming) subunit beta
VTRGRTTRRRLEATIVQATRTLSEFDSKQLLAAHGVPVAPERLTASVEEAMDAARALGFPVAVKLCGERIAHKTERGLVRLHLADPGAVRAAASALLAAARPADGNVGLLVGAMVRGTRELIAGCVRDPTFGRCVMLGVGGILAEALADVTFRLVPIGRADAEEMLDDLRHQALLGPFRGEPPVDRGRLVDVLLGLSDLVHANHRIVAVDVNPLIVAAGVPTAVDALVELAGG